MGRWTSDQTYRSQGDNLRWEETSTDSEGGAPRAHWQKEPVKGEEILAERKHQLKDDPKVRILTNHPVHMGNLSPSALIPYCWFGYNLDMENHTLPICDSFKPVQRKHQICYEMDPSLNMTGMKKNDKESFLRKGLYLLLDENKDRQSKQQSSSSTSIFLDAIGMNSGFFIIF